MTVAMDRAIHVEGYTFCAITEHDLDLNRCGSKVFGHGRKSPALILMIRNGTVSGVDLEGGRFGKHEIERRFPGVLDTIDTKQ